MRVLALDALREALHKTLSEYLTETDPIWAGDMPSWANHVTLHHLLTHTSGIFSYTSLDASANPSGAILSTAELVTLFKNKSVYFAPRG